MAAGADRRAGGYHALGDTLSRARTWHCDQHLVALAVFRRARNQLQKKAFARPRIRLACGMSFDAKFDGELANRSQTYASVDGLPNVRNRSFATDPFNASPEQCPLLLQ